MNKTDTKWVMVPVEPTNAMRAVIDNEHDVYESADALYAALLAAAPKAEPADPLQQLTELSERAGLYDADFKKPSVAPSVTRFNPADGSPETALQIAAVIALHDADKPAGEYPPLPAPAQGEPWYGHHFKEVRRGYWQCGCGKAIAEAAPATSKDSYPPLPNRYTYDDDGAELFTAVQMRAYVDADRTMRAQAAPAFVTNPAIGCHECYITHDLGACATVAPTAAGSYGKDNDADR